MNAAADVRFSKKMEFEWDAKKAKANLKNHKISFDEAKTVFGDPFLQTFPDESHSDEEIRFINVGRSAGGRIVVVIHTERERKIRIISCRRVTTTERKFYEEGK